MDIGFEHLEHTPLPIDHSPLTISAGMSAYIVITVTTTGGSSASAFVLEALDSAEEESSLVAYICLNGPLRELVHDLNCHV